jgi:predicted SAM-dependent methyltransferase
MIRILKKLKRSLVNTKHRIIFIYQLHIQKNRKLIIGSGGVDSGNDWISTDVNILDVTSHVNWTRLFKGIRLKNIMAEHVWEHLTEEQATLANANCFDFLQKGGGLRIAIPDGYHPDEAYIEHVRVGGSGPGADDHKVLYTYRMLKERLERAGFEVNLLEYWDETGKFHFVDWSNDGGLISRSRRYDDRNQGGQLKYTSLIVDAIKK